jgi:hypothetical protein
MKKTLQLLLLILLLTNYLQAQILPDNAVMEVKGENGINVVSNPTIIAYSPFILCGGTSTLTLAASPSSASFSYQWLFSATETGTYTNISGATSATFTTNPSFNVGYYKVAINDGTTPAVSPAFRVRQGATVTSTTVSPTTVSAGQSTTINATFSGTGPWYFSVFDLDGYFLKYLVSNTSNFTLNDVPNRSGGYRISDVYDSNGYGCNTVNQQEGINRASLTVGPPPTFTLGTPANLTLCSGETLDIPITYTGTWGNPSNHEKDRIGVNLVNLSGGSIGSPTAYINGQNSLKFVIPLGTANGSYKVQVYPTYPSSTNTISSFIVNVTNSNCGIKKPQIHVNNSGCYAEISVFPQGTSGYTYQWYKDGVPVINGTLNNYTVPNSSLNGNYTVTVTNSSLGYTGTSDARTVNVNTPLLSLTTDNSEMCTPTKTITLSGHTSGSTFQWFSNNYNVFTNTNEQVLLNETNSTLTISQFGKYSVRAYNGTCYSKSSEITIFPCKPTITSTNPIICGTNTQAVLQSSLNSAGVYQWSSSSSEFGTYTNISGATSSSYTATTTGFYKVIDNIGTLSNAFRVASTPYAVILNPDGNTNSMSIAAGGTAALTYNLYGVAPFTFTSSDGVNSRIFNSTTNQIIINHTPPSSRNFTVSSISNAGCIQTGSGQNSMIVNVGTPTVSIGTVASSICAGNTLSIPYTTNGAFDSNINLFGIIYNATTNNFVASTNNSSLNPLQLQIPATLAAGTYYIQIGGNLPFFSSSIITQTTSFSVTAACTPTTQASINGLTNACSNINLSAIPQGSGYNYQWSKDGTIISGATSSNYFASQSGSYVVTVTNNTNGYNSTSAPKVITVNSTVPVISSPNASFCGTNTSVTLNTTLTGSGYTYIWQKYNTSNFTYNTVAGQTTQSLTLTQASEAGQYRVVVNDGVCDNISQNFTVSTSTTARLVNSSGNTNAVNLNPGQTETLQLIMSGQSPFTYSFNGQNYTTSASTVSLPVTPSISTNYSVGSVMSSGTACGTSFVFAGSILVNVSPNPTFTIGTTTSTACSTAPFIIPLNLTGNWGVPGTEKFDVYLYTAAGSYVSYLGLKTGNPVSVNLPNTLTVGSAYKLSITPSVPYVPTTLNTSNFTFSLTCPSPCATTLTLISTTDDISSGTTTKEANATTGTITATNKISGTANVTYRAGKSITLDAGFKADNGTVFKTEFGGCN